MRTTPLGLLMLLLFCTAAPRPATLVDVKARAMRAGYAADLPALSDAARDARAIAAADPSQAALAHYWAGYALWQRAVNGVNLKADAAQIAADRDAALAEFQAALALRESFADAHALAAWLHGWQYMAGVGGDKEAHSKAIRVHIERARALEPDNPRVQWEVAYVLQRSDRERARQILTDLATRADTVNPRSPEPDWGVPEAAMVLAFSYASAKPPDMVQAAKYARRAQELRPHWMYVEAILMPMIEKQ
jgi:hypothetical protein